MNRNIYLKFGETIKILINHFLTKLIHIVSALHCGKETIWQIILSNYIRNDSVLHSNSLIALLSMELITLWLILQLGLYMFDLLQKWSKPTEQIHVCLSGSVLSNI